MKAARSVLIPDGEDELSLRVLRCLAQAREVKVSVLSRDERAPIRFSRHLHRFLTHRIEGSNPEKAEVIKRAAEQLAADIILPTGLAGTRLVAEFKNELGAVAHLPPLAPPEILDAFADKLKFSDILKREGIPHPKTVRPEGKPVDKAQLSDIKLPVLVKPRNLEGGNGIRLCESPSQVVEYLAQQSDPLNFFVQEFITGPDLSCSILSHDGEILAYTIQRVIVRSRKPFGPSAAIEFVNDEAVLDSIQRLVRSVRWSGVACFDLVLDEETNEAKVLEANPRYWRSLLGSLTAGVNFPHLACLASQGLKVPRPEYRQVRYARPEIAAGLILKSWAGGASVISKVSESGLLYLLRDPLPESARYISRVAERMGSQRC